MKILNIICSLDPSHGGPMEGATRLASIWNEQGHEVDFATLEHPAARYLKKFPHNVFALGQQGLASSENGPVSFWRRFGYSPRLVPWLRENLRNYDVAIVHGLWNYSTVAARRTLVAQSIPYFVFPHGCLDPWFKRANPRKDFAKRVLWPISEGVLMNNANAVLFTTEAERDLADNAYWPWKITPEVVGFGSSDVSGDAINQVAAFRSLLPALGERPYLLFLSRIHPKKGCDLLVEAFARMGDEHQKYDLVIAGPDEKGLVSELQALAKRFNVADRIHWPGMISGDAKWGAFRGCDAFILPSHTENFGIVVAEALACSKPVLITDKVNLWHEVSADQAGLVDSDTQEGVNRLLDRFIALSETDRELMSRRARTCFETRFRMDAAAAKILDVVYRHGART